MPHIQKQLRFFAHANIKKAFSVKENNKKDKQWKMEERMARQQSFGKKTWSLVFSRSHSPSFYLLPLFYLPSLKSQATAA